MKILKPSTFATQTRKEIYELAEKICEMRAKKKILRSRIEMLHKLKLEKTCIENVLQSDVDELNKQKKEAIELETKLESVKKAFKKDAK